MTNIIAEKSINANPSLKSQVKNTSSFFIIWFKCNKLILGSFSRLYVLSNSDNHKVVKLSDFNVIWMGQK